MEPEKPRHTANQIIKDMHNPSQTNKAIDLSEKDLVGRIFGAK